MGLRFLLFDDDLPLSASIIAELAIGAVSFLVTDKAFPCFVMRDFAAAFGANVVFILCSGCFHGLTAR